MSSNGRTNYSSSGFENMLLEPLAPFDLAVTPVVYGGFLERGQDDQRVTCMIFRGERDLSA